MQVAGAVHCITSRSSGDAGKLFFTFPRAKPNAENLQVQFDERGWETERCHMAQATAPLVDSVGTRDDLARRARINPFGSE